MLKTIKMPLNLMNLTDHLPKPAYQLQPRPSTKDAFGRAKRAKVKSSEKLAKTKYKGNFTKGAKSGQLVPLRLLKSRERGRQISRSKRRSTQTEERPTQSKKGERASSKE